VGPYYAFYRPYHLASIEQPLSIPAAVLDRKASLMTEASTAEVGAAAKRDLAPGDIIDGIGGYTVRGMIEDAAIAAAEMMVPLGVLNKATVLRPVKRGEVLTYDDVALDESSTIVMLRRLQDRLVASGGLSTELRLPAALAG
jgi:predicted homoserine dehydrogenase-like protein